MKWAYAAVAAVLTASSVTAAVRLSRDESTSRLAVQDIDPTPTWSPFPSPSPSVTRIPVPTTKPATPRPLPLPTLPVTTGSPARPTATAPPVQTGHWRHTAKGATLDLRISPADPRAGQLVTWTLALSGPAGCCHAQILYGDNQGGPEADEYCVGTKPYGRDGAARVMTLRHAYRRGGTYMPWIAVHSECTEGTGETTSYFTFKPTVRVAAGPLLSNGPWVPVGTIDDSIAHSGADPDAGQYFVAQVKDHDGAPVSWWWDWGDGTRTPVVKNPDTCVWPEDGGWVESGASSYLAHRYAQPGTYTVRFVATTAGCDGKGAQTFTAAMTWTVDQVTSSS